MFALVKRHMSWKPISSANQRTREFWRLVKRNNFLETSSCSATDDVTEGDCLDVSARTIDACPLADPDCTKWDR